MTIRKLGFLSLFLCILLCPFQMGLFSQETETKESNTIEPKLRLPVPRDKSGDGTYSLEDEIAGLISEVADQLFLDEVVVCIQVETTAELSDLPSSHIHILNEDDLNGFGEALVLADASLIQTDISQSRENGDFVETGDRHSRDVFTRLNLSGTFLDIKSKSSLGPFELEIRASASTPKESRAKVLDSLKKRLIIELKRIYWLSSDVDSIANDELTIPMGTGQGLKKGYLFELMVPERTWSILDQKGTSLPRSAGMMRVVETSSEGSILRLSRQWDYLEEGSWVVEHFEPSFALELFYVPPITNRYFSAGINYHARPFHSLDFGGGGQFIRITDSSGDDDYGVGFSGFGIWRYIDTPTIDLGGKLAANLDIPLKKDDAGTTVFTSLFSVNVGILAEMTVNKRFDIVFNAGYRLAIKSDKWTYSEGDDTYPAVWDGDAPAVDTSGLFFSLGFHYLLF